MAFPCFYLVPRFDSLQVESSLIIPSMNAIQEATSGGSIASFDTALDRLRQQHVHVPAREPLLDSPDVNCSSSDGNDNEFKQGQVDDLISLLERHKEALAESFATTVEEDAAYDKALRRYQERYEDAIKEQVELEERLSIQRKRHGRVIAELEGNLSALRDEHGAAAPRHEEEQQALDASQEKEIHNIQSHQRQMEVTLSTQKAELEDKLQQLQLQNQAEKGGLNSKRQELQDTIESTTLAHADKMQQIQNQTNDVQCRMDEENKKRQRLQDHFDLIDDNDRIRRKEEAVLRRVVELEEGAERILDNGATQLQRLFRGMRDRAIVDKMKNKKKRGGAKKKQKKKGGK